MKYVEYINQLIKEKLSKESAVAFGQNINAGSCLSGLTKGLKIKSPGIIINATNSENTLVGLGFGLMIAGVNGIFFMKQQDFLLLGIDPLVNTYNFIRRKNPKASFTIVFTIVDEGYQGLQSSLNNFSDFCSIARVPGFTITNKIDAEEIINKHLIFPGFRMIGISQRLFKQEILELTKIKSNEDSNMFKYSEGKDLTIVCFNLSIPYGKELDNKLSEKGIKSSLFSVNSPTPIKWHDIIEDVKKTKKIVIIDDSKSENIPGDSLMSHILEKCLLDKKLFLRRDFSKDWLSPNKEILEIDYEKIISYLG